MIIPIFFYWHPSFNIEEYYAIPEFSVCYIKTEEAFNLIKAIRIWAEEEMSDSVFEGEGWYDISAWNGFYKIKEEERLTISDFLTY